MKIQRKSVFISSALLLALVCLVFAVSGQEGNKQRVQITVLGTTDLHGNIYPLDYYTNKPDNRGLAKIATLIARARKENPNAMLIDSGDTIQGPPFSTITTRKTTVRETR